MSIPEIKPGTNGNHGAPHETSGALRMDAVWEAPAAEQTRSGRTEFPPDMVAATARSLLYRAYTHQIGGTAVTRWGFLLLTVLALLWATGFFPLRWVGVVLAGGAALLLGIAVSLLQREDFVRFFELNRQTAADAVKPRALPDDVKFPVYVTGQLEVEGKAARFTCLSGFYRTFATREHALLCRLNDSRFLGLARRPADQLGMWYAFFTPDKIVQVRTGKLQFDRRLRPAIAIDYTLTIPGEGRFKREKQRIETLLLVPADPESFQTILADLVADLPVPAEDAKVADHDRA